MVVENWDCESCSQIVYSSPVQEVLRVSYCDCAVSSVVKFLPCVHSRGHIFSPIIMKLVRMFVLMKSRTSSKMGYVGSKTRSLGPILDKPCVRTRGHIFSPIVMKFGQNVCLGKICDWFENGSCRVIN